MKKLLYFPITFNLVHHRSGHLFPNRYTSIICDKEPDLPELVRYILLHPIRAGLVKSLQELKGWGQIFILYIIVLERETEGKKVKNKDSTPFPWVTAFGN
jgi:hypothetical protein